MSKTDRQIIADSNRVFANATYEGVFIDGYQQAERDLAPAVRLAQAYDGHTRNPSFVPEQNILRDALRAYRATTKPRDPLEELARILDASYVNVDLDKARALCAEALDQARRLVKEARQHG